MNSITQQILSNPEGGTVHLGGAELPSTGYYVGGLVSPLILTDGDSTLEKRSNIDTFVAYLDEHTDAPYAGWWTDEETGKLWVDATSWHAAYDEAERVTRERGEIAFYDIERGREFRPVRV